MLDFADQLERAAVAHRASNAALVIAVRIARQDGRSWSQIGTALGISKQGARQRFAPLVEPAV